ncbi:MAG: prepilin peptidase [Blastocatellia bacterium]|nr:prepilin peptidase [Blastocatellia bacterium]
MVNTGIPDIDLLPEWFWVLTVTLFGLAIGSFLNVVIYRIPLMYKDEWEEMDESSDSEVSNTSKETKEQQIIKEKIAEEKIENIQKEAISIDNDKKEVVETKEQTTTDEEKISLVYPARSFCPNCKHQITALENIPILSYMVLGGKCRKCKVKISIIYPFVEALTTIAFLLAFYHQASKPIFSIADYVFNVAFISVNIALIFIDYQKMILPDVLTLWGALLALVIRGFVVNEPQLQNVFLATLLGGFVFLMVVVLIILLFVDTKLFQLLVIAGALIAFCLALTWLMGDPDRFFDIQDRFIFFWQEKLVPYPALTSIINSILGAIIGFGLLFSLSEIYRLLRGVDGMGGGDFKMMLFVGMYLGWQLCLTTLLLAPALAMLPIIAIFILKGNEAWQSKLPFGVFLGLGAIVSLLYGKQVIDGYFWIAQQYLAP